MYTVLRYIDIVYIIAYFLYLVDRRTLKFSIIQFFLLSLTLNCFKPLKSLTVKVAESYKSAKFLYQIP